MSRRVRVFKTPWASMFGRESSTASAVLSREHATWLAGGLAAALRRPPPSMPLAAEVSVAEALDLLRDTGYTVKRASLGEFEEAVLCGLASKWLLMRRGELGLTPAVVTGSSKGQATVLEPGKHAFVAEGTALRGLATEDAWQLLPQVATTEEELEPFGWRWMARAFFAHKGVIRDVVVGSFVLALVGLAFPLATQAIVDKVIANQAQSTLIALGVGIALMAVFSGLIGWLRQKLLLRLANVVDAELSRRVMHHLLSLPLPYFLKRPAGTIVNKVGGIERIREFMASAFLLAVLDLPFMLVFLGMMLSYSVPLSGIVLGFVAVMMVASFAAGPILRERANGAMQLGAQVQGFVTEHVAAVETVKALQLEPHVRRRFDALNERHLQATLLLREAGNTYGTFMQTTEQLMNAAVLCAGAWWAMSGGEFTIGMLVAFQMFSQRVAQPLLKLSGLWQELQQTRIATKMVAEVVNHPVERYSTHGSSASSIRGALSVQRLKFSYSKEQPPLYENLSFDVTAGSVVLMTGPSGCGKSTLAKMLLGLYTDYEGTIRLDGRDIRSMSVNELRSVFGVVPQESVLFAGSVIENLLAAAPEATFEQAVVACRLAGVHEAVENLPQGYQTPVGERGSALSGGQRQRLAIARALLKKPRVLVFDEAVASLDDQAAQQVAETVNQLAGRVTVLFVTHKVPSNLKVSKHLRLGAQAAPAAG